MQPMKIKQFVPESSAYNQRISPPEWKSYEQLIRAWHKARTTREEMLRMLREMYSFTPT